MKSCSGISVMPKRIDAQQQAAFQADGYLLVRELFATQEISLLNERLAEARGLDGKRFYVRRFRG